MKFILNTIIKTITLGIVLCALLVALWFVLTPMDRENLFAEYVQPLTGMSLNETIDKVKSKLVMDHSGHMGHMNHGEKAPKERKIKYWVAPMDANFRRDEPGKSPMGMDLVPIYEELDDESVAEEEMSPKERKIKYWVAPMDANFRRDEPGKSPMGMDLVPIYEELDDEPVAEEEMSPKERKIKYWVAPMDANFRRDKPGKSPMGMDLVPIYEELDDEPVAEEKMSPKERKIKYWVAPMDAKFRRDKPGKSPMGMDLVPVYEELDDEPVSEKGMSSKEKKIKYWVAPMDANFRRNEPGKSPMGMDLVPVYEEVGDMDSDTPNGMTSNKGLPKIRINPSIAQNMGVRIEKAMFRELSRTIKTIGSVSYNEDTLHHIHARSSGWVEALYTRSLGDPVTKGKALLEYYSPDIVAAQKDLIVSKRAGSNLSRASRTRLKDLNVSDEIIDKVIRTGRSINNVPIISKHTGVVTRIGIKNGMYITPGTEIYKIADLSTVWVIVDVFEHQLSWVKVGNKAIINVQAVPGRNWEGEIDYVYPELNPKTRTLKVRLKIDTPEQQLKPNMFADVTLLTNTKKALTVPTESIIYYENSPRLVKVVSENRYQPIEVKLGIKSEGRVEILEGISEGDDILVSGQFMIDSESNLEASFRRMMEK